MLKTFVIMISINGIFAQDTEIPLFGNSIWQSSTWKEFYPFYAIDGDEMTYAVVSDESIPSKVAWWEVDLGKDYEINLVSVTASKNEFVAKYLHNFGIWLLQSNRIQKLCYLYSSSQSIFPCDTEYFNCPREPFSTRFIRITKDSESYRPDAISLGEVRAYGKVFGEEYEEYEVPLAGLKTRHIRTWRGHESWLAIDGNPSTFSIACFLCDNTLKGGAGWWQIDLGITKPIVGVHLTSSLDQYNSNYLQDIVIGLTSWNDTKLANARICYDVGNSYVPPGTTFKFKCWEQPTWGRFVLVMRKETATFRPDAIAIAEFKVYESKNSDLKRL